ncbi:hypothetical protein NN3_12860 [Nocardia neocaledoniensis NBRC 108232]|uniref:DUF445 domain-containing protein n=1 Tax=Nocardia neocaledoniensis TaxID=236511 RepID=A0A317N834_9NOCA|nr:DUF445 domain-containing protein [Nocardia neocaledoniensis]PWV71053.1 hypothetical protein DFR69_11142 [Nocardia neocaledoniensis]GEM30279.1 hypothetical protein NN3_12860 [Nocardia neocaledoniensis NBRC 108232]
MIADLAANFTENWLLYASIPLVAAFIGWVTKLAAVEMLLRPLEFRGIPPWLGWQGVVPRAAPRMASIAIDLMFSRLIDPQEILRRIDVEEMTTNLREPLDAMVDHLVEEVMRSQQPQMWAAAPDFAKQALVHRIKRDLPAMIEGLVDDLRTYLDDIVDLRAMATDALTRDKALLVRMVRRVGDHELRFIVRSGLLFGFVLGLVQMITWAFTESTWLMPAFGALTGLTTDWLALQMIFRPIRPLRVGPLTIWQGMFHRRRAQVSEDYITLVTTEILSPAVILDGVLTGPRSDRVTELLARHIGAFMDSQARPVRRWTTAVCLDDGYAALKTELNDRILTILRQSTHALDPHALDALGLRETLDGKLAQLTDQEYEGLLRPAFKQDEWKLVAIGAVLGFLVGELQVQLLLT